MKPEQEKTMYPAYRNYLIKKSNSIKKKFNEGNILNNSDIKFIDWFPSLFKNLNEVENEEN